MRGGEREIIYLSLHCHHQNDFCFKVGSDESHFNVSVGSDGQSHKTVSTNHSLFEERRAEAGSNRGPSAYQPNALPLGHSGSQPTHARTGYLYTSACVRRRDEVLFSARQGSDVKSEEAFGRNTPVDLSGAGLKHP